MRPVLRVLGTAVTLNETIRARAEADLGIDIDYTILDGVAAQQTAVRSPGSFDIYDQWFHSLDVVWWAGVLQPVDTRRINDWDQIIHRDQALRMTGRADRSETMPLSRLYVSPDRRLGIHRTEAVTALPGVYNVDGFGYLPSAIKVLMNGDDESWGWLLDPRLGGKVALVADPTIGAAEAALALTAQGLAQFEDPADLSIAEIDTMVRILIQRKKAGVRCRTADGVRGGGVGQSLGFGLVQSLVARCGCAQRRAGGGLSRLAWLHGSLGAHGGSRSRRRLRLFQLVAVGLGRRADDAIWALCFRIG
jgi:putative spermidine/putrescine transport system substrate-binding protein